MRRGSAVQLRPVADCEPSKVSVTASYYSVQQQGSLIRHVREVHGAHQDPVEKKTKAKEVKNNKISPLF